jgi:hypothetical protein
MHHGLPALACFASLCLWRRGPSELHNSGLIVIGVLAVAVPDLNLQLISRLTHHGSMYADYMGRSPQSVVQLRTSTPASNVQHVWRLFPSIYLST